MATKTSGGNAAFHNFHNDYAHIADPNERRRLALAEIDKAPFGWYHVRAVVVAGIGFFTDAYDIFAINLVTSMLGVVYWHSAKSKPGTIPSNSDTAIKVATSGGTVIGQLAFGFLADVVGRKRMYGLELIIIIFATLAQALSASSPAVSIVGILIFWRVIMGIGIGGDYPLSSIITSEYVALPLLYISSGINIPQVRHHQMERCDDGFRVCDAGYRSIRRGYHRLDYGGWLQGVPPDL